MKGVVASMVLSATTGEKATGEGSIDVAFSIILPFCQKKVHGGFGDHVNVADVALSRS